MGSYSIFADEAFTFSQDEWDSPYFDRLNLPHIPSSSLLEPPWSIYGPPLAVELDPNEIFYDPDVDPPLPFAPEIEIKEEKIEIAMLPSDVEIKEEKVKVALPPSPSPDLSFDVPIIMNTPKNIQRVDKRRGRNQTGNKGKIGYKNGNILKRGQPANIAYQRFVSGHGKARGNNQQGREENHGRNSRVFLYNKSEKDCRDPTEKSKIIKAKNTKKFHEMRKEQLKVAKQFLQKWTECPAEVQLLMIAKMGFGMLDDLRRTYPHIYSQLPIGLSHPPW